MIEVLDVSHRYSAEDVEVEALRNITFQVKKAEFLSIIGPSGCGKSTLLNILGGLIRAAEGRVLMDGMEVKEPMPQKVAMVFQEPALFPWRTVEENVWFGLEVRGLPKPAGRETAKKYITLVGLAGFERMYPGELSGGMQHRVALARALATEPEVLLMDEPFGALDEQTRVILGEELTRIWQTTQKTIVFVTHSLIEAAYLADRIVVLSSRPGRVRAVVEVDIPRPREPEMPELSRLRSSLWQHISEEAKAAMGRLA